VKLRIKGSSLRLRLTQGELRDLAESGAVEERVPFGGNAALIYRLKQDPSTPEISATYAENVIEIRVPERAAREWRGTDLVTLEHSQKVSGGELRIVLEKDWACLAPREGEDESDNFPHPNSANGGRTC
jgi:hypothetical protein